MEGQGKPGVENEMDTLQELWRCWVFKREVRMSDGQRADPQNFPGSSKGGLGFLVNVTEGHC